MIPLYTQLEYKTAKWNDVLKCLCEQCNQPYLRIKKEINYALNGKGNKGKFCSQQCKKTKQTTKIEVTCLNCQNTFLKILGETKRTTNHFCCRSCSATYKNSHKTHGNRRSKLEVFLEERLSQTFSQFIFEFNHKTIIKSELDIYIPTLQLAFELNGIFHYKPIFGEKKFNQIQKNDLLKIQRCDSNQIQLYIINTSSMQIFSKKSAESFYITIVDIINNISKNRAVNKI